jgi:hypothetical protein
VYALHAFRTAITYFELDIANSEYAAQDQTTYACGMRLCIGESESGTPRAAENCVPFGDVEMLTQSFNVGDKMPCSVVRGVSIRARLTAASLVEQNHSIFRGVEEDGVGFGAIAAGSTMEENNCIRLDIKKFG